MVSSLDLFVLFQNNTLFYYHRATTTADYTAQAIENCYDFDAEGTLQAFVVSILNNTVVTYYNREGSYDSSYITELSCESCNVHLGEAGVLVTYNRISLNFYIAEISSWYLRSTLNAQGDMIEINSGNFPLIYYAVSTKSSFSLAYTTEVFEYNYNTEANTLFNALNISNPSEMSDLLPPSVADTIYQTTFSKDASHLGIITFGTNFGYKILRKGAANFTFTDDSDEWLSLSYKPGDPYYNVARSISFQNL